MEYFIRIAAVFLLPVASLAEPPAAKQRLGPSEAAVLQQLEGDDPVLAGKAAVQLGQRSSVSAQARAALVRALADERRAEEKRPYAIPAPYWQVCDYAERALRPVNAEDLGPLLQTLDDSDSAGARRRALGLIASIGAEAPTATPAVERRLADKHWRVRAAAIRAMLAVRSDSPSIAAQQLMPLMRDPDLIVRATCIEAIGKLGPAASVASQELIRLLGAKEAFYQSAGPPDMAYQVPIRYEAAKALGRVRRGGHAAIVPLYSMMMTDSVPSVRVAAAFAYARIASDPAPAFEVLRSNLKDWGQGTQRTEEAAKLLGELGPAGKPCLESLVKVLRHPDDWPRAAAARAVAQVAPERASRLLAPLVTDRDSFVRLHVVEAIGTLPNQTDKVIPLYLEVIARPPDDEYDPFEYDILSVCVNALAAMGSQASRTVPTLEALASRSDDENLQKEIRDAIRTIEGDKKP